MFLHLFGSKIFLLKSYVSDCLFRMLKEMILLIHKLLHSYIKSMNIFLRYFIPESDFLDPMFFLTKECSLSSLGCCFHGGGSGFFCVFALLLAESSQTSLGTSVQDSLTILVHLELDDQELWRVDADINVGSVGFLALYSLDVYDELLSVHLHNFADLVSFVVTTNDLK